ncbi:hypothetical protein FRC03_002658 [Tulasnella sp. 419]|nr:hypothetical protein FRC03_002658 [Tulasnella sp. 419]
MTWSGIPSFVLELYHGIVNGVRACLKGDDLAGSLCLITTLEFELYPITLENCSMNELVARESLISGAPPGLSRNSRYSLSLAQSENTGKYYAIRNGSEVGIFYDYNDVNVRVRGVKYGCQQKFCTRPEAHAFLTSKVCQRKGCRGKNCPPVLYQQDVKTATATGGEKSSPDSSQYDADIEWDMKELVTALHDAEKGSTQSRTAENIQPRGQNIQLPIQQGSSLRRILSSRPVEVDGHVNHPVPPTQAFGTTSSLTAHGTGPTVIPATLDLGIPLQTYLKVHHPGVTEHIQLCFDTAYTVPPNPQFMAKLTQHGLTRAEGQLVLLLFNCR